MNCPHTWFSTELRGGRRLLRARLRDLLRPAPRRGRALALAAAALALCAGALVACRTAPAEESNPPVLVEEEAAQVILRLSPAALGLEEGSLTLSEPFSVELGGAYYQYFDLLQGEDIVAEVSVDHSTGAVRLHPTASELTISLVEPELPRGAIAFRETLPALVARYTDMDPEGALTFFYLGDYLSQDFPSVWGFRAVQRRGSGWVVLDDWYQDQAEGQVFNRNFNLEGLFSYVPGTFRFPVSFPNPAGRFYPELDQYARALAGGGAYRYSHMTLTAAHYFDPEDPEGMGFDGVAAYENYVAEHGHVEPEGIEPGSGCLIQILAGPEDLYPTLPEGRELLTLGRWTDSWIPGGNGWYYLPVSDFTWYPRSQFWADYQEVFTWLTSRAVFTLY